MLSRLYGLSAARDRSQRRKKKVKNSFIIGEERSLATAVTYAINHQGPDEHTHIRYRKLIN